MASEILRTAYKEREVLQSELSKNATWQKLQQVQKLIDTYESFEEARTLEAPRAAKTTTQTPPARYGSKVAQVDEVVAQYLHETGVRASSGDLLPVVEKAGIEMKGKVPSKTLSSFLSMSKRFNNLKGHGYGLAEWGNSHGPNRNEFPLGYPDQPPKAQTVFD